MSVSKYKPYPEYKDSGFDWVGEVPVEWALKSFKRFSDIFNGATPKSGEETFWDGDVVWITPADLGKSNNPNIKKGNRNISKIGYSSCGTSIVPPKALILSCRAPIGSIGISSVNLCTNQGCKSIVLNKDCNHKFFYYVLSISSEQLNQLGKGTTFIELSSEELKSFKVPFPILPEQFQIAAFLDHETAKIDKLIEKQKKLVELLKEKRQAIISHAVTKGLNPDAPMKDSGVEWLGEVPEHWVIASLKHLVSVPIIDGPHISPNRCDDGIPFISAEAISNGKIDFSKKWGFISEYDNNLFSKRYCPRKGDVLIVKLGATTGVAAIVDTDDNFNIWVPLAAVRMNNRMLPKYFLYLLQSVQIQDAIQLSWTFGTQQTLGLKTLSDLYIPIPSVEEQQVTVNFIEKDIPIIDNSIDNSFDLISLLQERRTALISAAVTGKIDVRDWKPPESKKDESNMPVEDICSI